MRNKFLKQKAVFMIYLTISLMFTIYLIPSAFAEEAIGTTACCERTISGDTCIYTEIENCDESYDIATFQYCEDTDICKVGCCVDEEDGSCSKQTSKATCEFEGFTWYEAPECDIAQCEKGCCVLSQASCAYVTETKCEKILLDYPELTKDFRPSGSEIECTDICREADTGCCVAEGGDSCIWMTRANCGLQDGIGDDGFYKDVFCSNENLACECEYHGGEKRCLDGTDDVYWFDSCDNPEDIAEDCDYARQGSVCNDADEEHDEPYCKSVDCSDTWDDPVSPDPKNGGPRLNGEAWCSYDSATGPTSDTVGSRHYRHICINGEEIVEPCRDYREETCFNNESLQPLRGVTIDNAGCIPNRWQDCATECATAKDASDETERERMMLIDKRCCEMSDLRDCSWVGDETSGLCIPTNAPGFPFWPEDETSGETPDADAATECEKGSHELKAQWVTRGATNNGNFKKYWCKQNCEIYTDEFFEERNQYCRSLGDCGAHYNYLGGFSDEGIIRTWTNYAPCFDDQGGQTCGEFNNIIATLAKNLLDDQEPAEGRVYDSTCQKETKMFITEDLAGEFQTEWEDTSYIVNLQNFDIGESWGTGWAGKWGAVLLGFLATFLICTVCGISDLITAWPYNEDWTVTIDCKTWTAPPGGSQCEECDKPFKPCSEYRCRSLGSTCRFIPENEGTGKATCYDAGPNDVTNPIITWNEDAFQVVSRTEDVTSQFSTSSMQGGRKIEGKLPAFSKVTFGITTNELSQCFIDTEFIDPMRFIDLTTPFPDTLFSLEHNITYNNLLPNTEYKFYIGCRDPVGNPKIDDLIAPYVIELTTDDSPDMSAPRIIATELPEHGLVPAHLNETEIMIYVDENSDFKCKIEKEDRAYDLMEQEMGCQAVPSGSVLEAYSRCNARFNVTEGENVVYIRCQDDPVNYEPNTMSESYEVRYEKTDPLEIVAAGPSGDLYQKNITMFVETIGGADSGRSTCTYFGTLAAGTFGITNASHSENVFSNLPENTYVFNVTCADFIGNQNETQIVFSSKRDYDPPLVENVYKSGSTVYLVLNEPATCQYENASFSYGYGTTSAINTVTHAFSGQDLYYVICSDIFDNEMEPVIVYPYLPKIEKVSGSSTPS